MHLALQSIGSIACKPTGQSTTNFDCFAGSHEGKSDCNAAFDASLLSLLPKVNTKNGRLENGEG